MGVAASASACVRGPSSRAEKYAQASKRGSSRKPKSGAAGCVSVVVQTTARERPAAGGDDERVVDRTASGFVQAVNTYYAVAASASSGVSGRDAHLAALAEVSAAAQRAFNASSLVRFLRGVGGKGA